MTGLSPQDTSLDAFWGGAVWLRQPKQGFRAGTASVLLAASLPESASGLLVDLGAGVGTVSLLAAKRCPALQTHGMEIYPDAQRLFQENAQTLGLSARCFCTLGSVFEPETVEPSGPLAESKADWLVCNPPFMQRGAGRAASHAYKRTAHQSPQDLSSWLAAAKTWLKPGKRMTFILPASRLASALGAAERLDLGAAHLRPVYSYADKPAKLVLVSWRKNRQGDTLILPSLVLYDAPGQPTAVARAILQEGRGIEAALQNPDLP